MAQETTFCSVLKACFQSTALLWLHISSKLKNNQTTQQKEGNLNSEDKWQKNIVARPPPKFTQTPLEKNLGASHLWDLCLAKD